MPKIIQITSTVTKIISKKRVAAYARVSMDTEMLLHSLSAQVSYYSSLIQNTPNWEYAGVYADEGITGTSTLCRNEFNRLIADCEAGKIDMVLVKSISRFARDTVDCLKTTRHLKELGIAVYFEREKINSLSEDGELMLTLLASFAQEESRSISENIKWAIRKKFENGIPNGHKAPYGYKWSGDVFTIIPEEGEIVKEIYRRYLNGESAYGIAKSLVERGIKGQKGSPMEQTTVKDILSNISYTGTMLLQKNYFTEGHIRKKNNGELPRYLVEGMFEPLVTEDDYQKALEIRKTRANSMPNKNVKLTAFSGIIKCGNCGHGVSRRTAGNKKKWVCNTRERKGMAVCDCRPIYEEELISAAICILGADIFDELVFKNKVKQVTVNGDYIEFIFKNGSIKRVDRKYSGARGLNPFCNKLVCGNCGGKCERDTYGKKGKKVWCCSSPRKLCQLKRLDEADLIKASISIFGNKYEGKIVQYIDRIIIYDDKLEFVYKDGKVIVWQR